VSDGQSAYCVHCRTPYRMEDLIGRLAGTTLGVARLMR
jgi:hypothetical protein